MDKELRELVEGAEGRAEKATAGDWTHGDDGWDVFCNDERAGRRKIAETRISSHNGPFIAHARQDVPALCAAVRRLDEEREKLNRAVCVLLRALDTAEADPLGTGLTKRRAVEARAALETIVGSPYAGCDLEDIP